MTFLIYPSGKKLLLFSLCTEWKTFTFPAASSCFFSFAACSVSALISAMVAIVRKGTAARQSRVSCQLNTKAVMTLALMLLKLCSNVAMRTPAAWSGGKDGEEIEVMCVDFFKKVYIYFLWQSIQTPWTSAASTARLVIKAPTLFLGSSNQPRS